MGGLDRGGQLLATVGWVSGSLRDSARRRAREMPTEREDHVLARLTIS